MHGVGKVGTHLGVFYVCIIVIPAVTGLYSMSILSCVGPPFLIWSGTCMGNRMISSLRREQLYFPAYEMRPH